MSAFGGKAEIIWKKAGIEDACNLDISAQATMKPLPMALDYERCRTKS
jgi:hypothetical protein